MVQYVLFVKIYIDEWGILLRQSSLFRCQLDVFFSYSYEGLNPHTCVLSRKMPTVYNPSNSIQSKIWKIYSKWVPSETREVVKFLKFRISSKIVIFFNSLHYQVIGFDTNLNVKLIWNVSKHTLLRENIWESEARFENDEKPTKLYKDNNTRSIC